jgi:regulatory protein YycH of two-component signal transduction system YycFG
MRFEQFKSLVLTLLVVISAFLTWNIWTYQPTYEKTDQSEFIKVERDEQDVGKIVKPDSVIFHQGNQHYKISNEKELQDVTNEFSTWPLYGVEEITDRIDESGMTAFIEKSANTEIVFGNQVPFKLYKSVLTIEESETPEFSFDRVVFTANQTGKREGTIYFISMKTQRIIEGKVEASYIHSFYQDYFAKAEDYSKQIAFDVNDNLTLYVPEKSVKLNQNRYYIGYLDINNFIDGLFTDPNLVRRESVAGGDEYTDVNRLLKVNKSSAMISYINPTQKRKVAGSTSDLLQQSIDFVNDHAGWEKSNYRFSGLEEQEQSVAFRLYANGYPVFNEIGMSEMKLYWGSEEVYRYERPYFYLDFALPTDNISVTLPSGQEAINALKKIRNLDLAAIEDLKIGYRLIQSPSETKIVILEPAWYYRYGGTWVILPFEQTGGD